ncbi:hypothetical protein CWI42_020810 [Ordospora colligata]|uniref:Uncharacterized protein n=1 Tax=Ordospora colligata OC4 TaxID=1354746 RepID=A0A0B2UGT8_9MICR|nr:uncharacterized protein M896_020820 [Ordospora colligata OC4]KHN70246.1 hypothetical protein M896_020820 [Ordospora colligata OC4]TBU16790.1 hypothetical protein CWI41_020830 [Ordospora colligata]TBU16898.1 hypothetical protein CWI40_020830 [Ordospora colligata]TBU19339.1 hypothetical protein CWI42_020810 [Ordospora colligata]
MHHKWMLNKRTIEWINKCISTLNDGGELKQIESLDHTPEFFIPIFKHTFLIKKNTNADQIFNELDEEMVLKNFRKRIFHGQVFISVFVFLIQNDVIMFIIGVLNQTMETFLWMLLINLIRITLKISIFRGNLYAIIQKAMKVTGLL